MKALVIVESPTKAKTISRFLGPEYRVEASMGHVRDLPSSASEIPVAIRKEPWARIGVNVEDGFQPLYVVPTDKKQRIKELKTLLSGVEELFIATDEDREGESIGWHLLEVLKPKVPTKRMVFHEITEEAIRHALANTRELNMGLVTAQETRRVLDRLVGYIVSPLLWKKVASKLSAGRVQSAAVKLLVARERERMSFRSGEWWDLNVELSLHDSEAQSVFTAQLSEHSGKPVAQGAHFDPRTGLLLEDKQGQVDLLNADSAGQLTERLRREGVLIVDQVERREVKKTPLPPFITSTLQQEANRRLNWGTSQTMRVAQRLYENGYITYMRTDAPALADEAVNGIRSAIRTHFGEQSLPVKPQIYRTKAKGAQEAHEAIRPAGTEMRTASTLGLSGQEAQLYQLIWQRTMACQMTPASLSYTTARLSSRSAPELILKASGKEVLHPGFMAAYQIKDNEEMALPPLHQGQELSILSVNPQQHMTKAPARFNEAALVKSLEQEGIGRPSTYASIIETIQKRGYVRQAGKQLIPTFTALAVTQLLEHAFSDIVDPDFTASMEHWLDEITVGGDSKTLLSSFHDQQLMGGMVLGEALDPREICAVRGDRFGDYEVRVGRFGPFIEYQKDASERITLSLPADLSPDEVSIEYIQSRIQQAEAGAIPLGHHPESREPIFLKEGRYGLYVQLGDDTQPLRSSLPRGLSADEITFDQALFLLKLPLSLGAHPDTGEEVILNLGRYGSYVQHQSTSASLKPEHDLFAFSLGEAVKLLTERASDGGKRKGQEVLRVLGDHPESGPIQLIAGRYGPYMKCGGVNISIPKTVVIDDLTLELALPLVNEGLAKKVKKKAATKKAATKKAATKKAATKKALND